MKVYVDLLFIVNFIIDLIILLGLGRVLKYKIHIKRLISSVVFGSVMTSILFINMNIIILNLLKFLISIVMVIICFGRKSLFKKIFYFYLISIILGGFIYLIKNSLSDHFTLLILLILSPITIYLYVKEQLIYKSDISTIYNVCLYIDNKKYELRGLLDTGNSLKDPYKNRPVILLNNDIRINKSRFIIIPYKALNYEGVIRCIKPDRVVINNIEYSNCLLGLSDTRLGIDIDCILPNKFMEEI